MSLQDDPLDPLIETLLDRTDDKPFTNMVGSVNQAFPFSVGDKIFRPRAAIELGNEGKPKIQSPLFEVIQIEILSRFQIKGVKEGVLDLAFLSIAAIVEILNAAKNLAVEEDSRHLGERFLQFVLIGRAPPEILRIRLLGAGMGAHPETPFLVESPHVRAVDLFVELYFFAVLQHVRPAPEPFHIGVRREKEGTVFVIPAGLNGKGRLVLGNLEDVSDVLADAIRSFLNGLGHNGHIHLREKAHREDAAQTLGLDAVMTLKKVPTWTFLGNDRIHRHVDGKVAFLEIAEFHDDGIIEDFCQTERIRILMLRNL